MNTVMQRQFLRVLDGIANIAVVVIAVAVLASIAYHHISSRTTRSKTAPGLTVGQPFPPLPAISYEKSSLTVVLFLNPRCVSCRESLADYALLQRVAAESNGRVRIFSVFTRQSANAFVASQIGLPEVDVDDFRSYSIAGTPTIVVVDRLGKIEDFWVGKLTDNARSNIVDRIKRERTYAGS